MYFHSGMNYDIVGNGKLYCSYEVSLLVLFQFQVGLYNHLVRDIKYM
jgi:hypothetical protein